LHGLQAVTTLLQAVRPPRDVGHHVVEGEVVGREVAAAILAVEAVAQEDIEPREGRPARRRHVFP